MDNIQLTEADVRAIIRESVTRILSEAKNTEPEILRQKKEAELEDLRSAGLHPEVSLVNEPLEGLTIMVTFPENEMDLFQSDRSYYKFVEDTLNAHDFYYYEDEFGPIPAYWYLKDESGVLGDALSKKNERMQNLRQQTSNETETQRTIRQNRRKYERSRGRKRKIR